MTRLANLNKPHTLEFHYQDKLLVSSVYAEYKDSKQANNTSKELESNIPITIHLKAYYNQDSIPNKEEQKQYYQNQKTQTKWGYITSSPYQHTTKENINSPIKEHETFRILADSEGNEIVGEEITIHLKEEWLDRQIRFFAFIENPKYEVGVTLYIYSPMQYKEEGLIDVSGYIVGFFAGTKAKAAYQFGYSAINAIANLGRDNTKTIDNIPIQTLSNQAARRWYNDKLNTIGNPYRTIQDLRQQAEKLHELRNTTKQQARELMQDRIMAWRLNIDPRTKIKPFEYYVKKYSKKERISMKYIEKLLIALKGLTIRLIKVSQMR